MLFNAVELRLLKLQFDIEKIRPQNNNADTRYLLFSVCSVLLSAITIFNEVVTMTVGQLKL